MSQPNDLVDHPRINWIVSKSKVDKYFIFDIYPRFEGNYEGHECLIELKDVLLEDAGQWKCEMESYVWGIGRGYTRKKAMEVQVTSNNDDGVRILTGEDFQSQQHYKKTQNSPVS